MTDRRRIRTLLLALALAAAPGCIERSISVRSNPPGAAVYLDGLDIGRTPVEHYPFHFYGDREIALYKDGYLCERRTVEIDTPWYAYFPLDIVTELVLPWTIKDRRPFHFDLRPGRVVEIPALLRHADDTREVARTRIAGAREASDYRPRAYLVKDAEKEFILFVPFSSKVPPRVDPEELRRRVKELERQQERKKESGGTP
jgi:hypothetical protein